MAKKKKEPIPKIKSSDRVKLIDVPELLVVVPLTHAASVRYGHKSRWCTSKSTEGDFNTYTRQGILIYVLMFDTENGGRKGDAITKVALYRRKSKVKPVWDCYDFYDQPFDPTPIKWLFDKKYAFTDKINAYFEEVVGPIPVFNNPFKVGDMIRGLGDKILIVHSGKWTNRISWVYKRRFGKSFKKVSKKPLQGLIQIEIHTKDILRAEVIKVFKKSVRVELKELNGDRPIVKYLLDNYRPCLNLTIKKEPQFEKIEEVQLKSA